MSPLVRLEAVMEQKVDMLLAPLQALLVEIGGFLPRLGLALVVLLVGFLVAKAARFTIEKGLRALNLHVVTRRSASGRLGSPSKSMITKSFFVNSTWPRW